jgi:hypothetical protein
MSMMPKAKFSPFISPRSIDSLTHEFAKFDPDAARKEYPWADRFVLGLPLAPWQREFKWSEDQCVRFINSIWSGVHLGNYIVTEAHYKPGAELEYVPLTNMVIDGQQRLTAIEMYIQDKFATPDADGNWVLWSEVGERDKRRFHNTHFSRGEVRETDELKLRSFYDLLNYGGTPHEEHERALDNEGKPKRPKP